MNKEKGNVIAKDLLEDFSQSENVSASDVTVDVKV